MKMKMKKKKVKIWMERQRDKEMTDFSFVFELYNLHFSIFQGNYVVLLMSLFDISFNFSIFQE